MARSVESAFSTLQKIREPSQVFTGKRGWPREVRSVDKKSKAKRVSRQSLYKGGGTSMPMDGAGMRNSGRRKLMPMNHTESTSSRESLKNIKGTSSGMKGTMGPKRT